jgi:hypothetical protein
MDLTAEEFASIVQSLGGIDASKAHEKRRAARIEYTGFVDVLVCTDGGTGMPIRTQVVDLSSRGIALTLPQSLQSGDQFIVQFPQYPKRQVRILCTVAHCRKQSDTQFAIGAEFTCVLPSQPLAAARPQDVSRLRDSILK